MQLGPGTDTRPLPAIVPNIVEKVQFLVDQSSGAI